MSKSDKKNSSEAGEEFEERVIVESLLGIISKILPESENKLKPESDLIEIGVSSLEAVLLGSEVRKHFGIELSAKVIFENPTVAYIAKYIHGEHRDGN